MRKLFMMITHRVGAALVAALLLSLHASSLQASQDSLSDDKVLQELFSGRGEDAAARIAAMPALQRSRVLSSLRGMLERAVRPDAPGEDDPTSPVPWFDSSALEEILQCICLLKEKIGHPGNCPDITTDCEDLETVFQYLCVLCEKGKQTHSKLDGIESQLDEIEGDLVTIFCTLLCVKDITENILSKVCIVESKVDGIGQTIIDQSQTIIDQLGQTICDKTDPILSKVCVIESKVDGLGQTIIDQSETVIDQLGQTICDKTQTILDTLAVDVMLICNKIINQSQTVIDQLGETIVDNTQPIFSKLCVVESLVDNLSCGGCDEQSIIDQLGKTIVDNTDPIFSKLCVVESKVDGLGATIIDQSQTVIEQLGQTIVDNTQPILSKVCVVESKIDALHDCVRFTIRQSDVTAGGGTYTIAAPGTYCVAEDLFAASPVIIVSVNNVVLDLNGHKISSSGGGTGIEVSAGVSEVVIFNGSVEGDGTGLGINLASGSSNITLHDLTVKSWDRGIGAILVDSLVMRQCLVSDCETQGLFADASTNFDIRGCSFNGNEDGLSLNDADGFYVEGCHFNGNSQNGVLCEDSACCEFVNCRAIGEQGNQDGFNIISDDATTSDIVIRDCFACHYINGFHVVDVEDICIINSVAKGNQVGFNIEGDATEAIIQECKAMGNTDGVGGGRGFRKTGTGGVQFYSNVACDNDLNYTPNITVAPVTSPANARGVDNVDCDNAAADDVETILSKVCVIESKVDGLGVTIVDQAQTIIEQLGQTIVDQSQTVIEQLGQTICDKTDPIFSKLCVVESKVDGLGVTIVDQAQTIIEQLGQTIVDQSQTVIEQLGQTICDKTDPIFSKLCVVESNVDGLVIELESVKSKVCEIDMNIGDLNQTIDQSVVDAIVDISDINATTDFTVLQWLKAIFYKVK